MAELLTDPTTRTYSGLTDAYAFFNARLFTGRLPACLITMQRKSKTYGYFAGRRFTTRDGVEITDEIALNPSYFAERSTEATLATLVHEMVHLEQQHFGTPSRPGYHNREWARMMRAVGLIPTATGEPGGKQTGQQMDHCIEPGGRFARACTELVAELGFSVPYVELWDEAEREARERKAASKTRYTCPGCGMNAWAKPGARLACDACHRSMEIQRQ
ncbi:MULTISPECIES: SprT-like domain-containing protein [Methylobacterium]|jgi:hypothetical protein|uniref:SprT-like domain-containing protein n=1 Tax=Methylobacterium persicinum TaxID=374426 RepID=A0ABU0HSV5_9HYPH|nr:SprT-like domain-containing protein [Methylobacterium persicinum]KOX42517.1 hypothetical protein ADL19_30220 [Streptomyces purpurogeneiscleroticus]MCA3182962.1 SprT-like domain-containing protein [Cupriavidus sp.]MDQ0445432.1 hypothetical protein [Methylobacterium persicinum]GJE38323.1 hypothetical protein KHHGKMAE_2395 [Methylobacterium persicinum]